MQSQEKSRRSGRGPFRVTERVRKFTNNLKTPSLRPGYMLYKYRRRFTLLHVKRP
jgi:hypothetical protein